jgi:hypothetical protein
MAPVLRCSNLLGVNLSQVWTPRQAQNDEFTCENLLVNVDNAVDLSSMMEIPAGESRFTSSAHTSCLSSVTHSCKHSEAGSSSSSSGEDADGRSEASGSSSRSSGSRSELESSSSVSGSSESEGSSSTAMSSSASSLDECCYQVALKISIIVSMFQMVMSLKLCIKIAFLKPFSHYGA